MAQRVQVLLIDDLDSGQADETVTFGLDGSHYEIDLSSANAKKLRDDLASWVGHARKVSARRGPRPGGPRKINDVGAVRKWARDNGYDVSDRGRIKAPILEAYERAQGASGGANSGSGATGSSPTFQSAV